VIWVQSLQRIFGNVSSEGGQGAFGSRWWLCGEF
jgi:hypothetical protein